MKVAIELSRSSKRNYEGLQCIIILSSYFPYYTDLSTKSAEVVIMTAFMAHRFKDISRGQLLSALNSLSKNSSEFRSADKAKLAKPLAIALIRSRVIKVGKKAILDNITMVDCKKIGTI